MSRDYNFGTKGKDFAGIALYAERGVGGEGLVQEIFTGKPCNDQPFW